MRSRYRTDSSCGPYFVTSTVVEWLPLFTSAEYCDLIADSLTFCRVHKELLLHAYVIMDTHIHLVVSGPDVSGIMRDFKSFTARKVIEHANADGKEWLLNQLSYYRKKYKEECLLQVWQEGYHPELIASAPMLFQKIEYLHNNPVRRGLVASPEHWVYSSARNYASSQGRIEIDEL